MNRSSLLTLLHTNPRKLLELTDSLPAPLLTYTAEYLGLAKEDGVLDTLLRLTSHPSPLVREGAVYGLESFGGAEARLREMLEHDASPGVREAAYEALN